MVETKFLLKSVAEKRALAEDPMLHWKIALLICKGGNVFRRLHGHFKIPYELFFFFSKNVKLRSLS